MINLQSVHRPLSDAPALVQRLGAGLRRWSGANALPRLADVHPGVPAGGRWIGLQNVPVECVRGTASLAMSRGRDFRPLRGRAPADWNFRWSRLLSATRDQTKLPPVQLIRAGGDYWVVDGHNRVALARQHGQVWIDADVTELDLSSDNAAAVTAKEN
jgi:hypothetical protein